MREIVTVESITDEILVLRTTKDELYYVDAASGEGLETGDYSIIIYDSDDKVLAGDHYNVTPMLLEQATNKAIEKENNAQF